MPRPDTACDHGADAEHRSEVERVRADDDSDRDVVLVLHERRDRGRNLGRVGCQRGEQAEERLGQAEPQPHVIEPAREHRRREQHQRDGRDEEWDGEGGRHRLTPTSLPGTPGGTLPQLGSRILRRFGLFLHALGRLGFFEVREPGDPADDPGRGPGSPNALSPYSSRRIASSSADPVEGPPEKRRLNQLVTLIAREHTR